MEEKKYHIEESKIAGDKVCEPSPAYRSAASAASSVSWDEAYDTDSYPLGRSLEQVMEHCAEIDKHFWMTRTMECRGRNLMLIYVKRFQDGCKTG